MSTLVVGRVTAPAQPRAGVAGAPRVLGGVHPKMQIVAEGRTPFVVPYAPRETTADGIAAEFETVTRGGRRPLLLRSGGTLETYQFELIIAHPDPDVPVHVELARLRELAASGDRMSVSYDAHTARFLWRMTSFNMQVIARQHGTNHATRAICQVTLTEVSDPVKRVGPVSGGGGGGGGGKGGGDKKRPKVYVWKKGDTWPKVAKRFYGNAGLWDDLADHNKIKRPKKIKPGTKIKLPRKIVLTGGSVVSAIEYSHGDD